MFDLTLREEPESSSQVVLAVKETLHLWAFLCFFFCQNEDKKHLDLFECITFNITESVPLREIHGLLQLGF